MIASVPPRKEEMMRSINYYCNVLPELDVTFRLGQEFSEKITLPSMKSSLQQVQRMPSSQFLEKDLPTVVSAWDVLAKKEIVFGKVSVIGGGLVGVETAEYLNFLADARLPSLK